MTSVGAPQRKRPSSGPRPRNWLVLCGTLLVFALSVGTAHPWMSPVTRARSGPLAVSHQTFAPEIVPLTFATASAPGRKRSTAAIVASHPTRTQHRWLRSYRWPIRVVIWCLASGPLGCANRGMCAPDEDLPEPVADGGLSTSTTTHGSVAGIGGSSGRGGGATMCHSRRSTTPPVLRSRPRPNLWGSVAGDVRVASGLLRRVAHRQRPVPVNDRHLALDKHDQARRSVRT